MMVQSSHSVIKLLVAGIALIVMASLAVNLMSELYSSNKSVLVEQNDESAEEENNSEKQEKNDEFGLPEFAFDAMSKAEWLSLHQYSDFVSGHVHDIVTPPPEV